MFNNRKIGAIIAAAGKGMRMGRTDKIFAPIGGKPLLLWVMDTFQRCGLIDQIIVVLGEENIKRGQQLTTEGGLSKVSDICPGGDKRQQSVANGLNLLDNCYWVVIHDGARPVMTEVLIKEGLEAAEESGAAIAAVPVIDTIKLADNDGFVLGTPPRNSLWAVQTPQVFRFDIISQAHSKAKGLVTDDAALVERLGYKIKLYRGSYTNIKVTNPSDLALVEILLKG